MLGTLRKSVGVLAVTLAVAFAPPAHASFQSPAEFNEKIEQAKASMMADSSAALGYAREARELANSDDVSSRTARLTAQWLEAEALMRLNRGDEASELVSKSLQEVSEVAPGGKLHADLTRSKGSLSAMSGEYGVALSSFLDAHELYRDLGEARSEAIVLQNIGSLYSDARDYERVLGYYRQAKTAFPEDLPLSLSAHNNTGNALKELERYDEAEVEFREALKVAEQMESPLLEARILTNIASTQYLAGDLDQAESTIQAGLAFSDQGAEQWEPFLYGVRAQIAFKRGETALAERYLARTFEGQDLGSTPPYFRDFHEAGALIYGRLGRHEMANRHLTAFNRIEGQARDLSAAANNALLGARFDAANRELRISKLSAEKAANDVALAKSRNQVTLLSAGIAFAVLTCLILFFSLRAMARSKRAMTAANEKLTYVSQHDGLTGLFGRDHFRKLLEDEQESAAKAGESGVLMLIDLDRFKQVNDIYGHLAGDKVLTTVAQRFREAAGEGAVIGRLGGDEFAIFLPHHATLGDAKDIAAQIIVAVSQPCEVGDHDVTVGASIGICSFGIDRATTSVLMTNADLALYEAKRRGRGTYTSYESWMRTDLEERSDLENDLAVALAEGQMSISYQPIINVPDRKTVCYEALMRWNHPVRGVIGPSAFIPIAEDALQIEQLGAWMLRTACAEAATWEDDIKVTVNVSSLQLANGNFLGTVVEALASSGLAPERLILELTESVVLEMDEQLETLLASLNKLGVRFALDDFGRGYSSLNYIEKMQFSMIKIDRDFVQSAAAGSRRSEAIVSAIVSLAQSLEIDVTAEGIEEEGQIDAMSKLGCSCFQGFHFGRPEPMTAGKKGVTEKSDPSRKVA